MENFCEQCGVELINFEDIIYESHTKRGYCRACGAYVGTSEFIIVEENNIPSSIINI